MLLSNLHTNRNKLKGSEDFKWNNIGLASFRSLAHMISVDDFSQTIYQGMLAR